MLIKQCLCVVVRVCVQYVPQRVRGRLSVLPKLRKRSQNSSCLLKIASFDAKIRQAGNIVFLFPVLFPIFLRLLFYLVPFLVCCSIVVVAVVVVSCSL